MSDPYKTLIVFDMDDTLVNAKMIVPRQTYHMLNRFHNLKYDMAIITYNPMAEFVACATNLYKYTHIIVYANVDRHILFRKCIEMRNGNKYDRIIYVDDRIDNITCVKYHFPSVHTYLCKCTNVLYKLKYAIDSSM